MEVKNVDNEVYSFALKNALNEIQNICPDIKNSFMFKEDGEIVAGDENTPEKVVVHVIDSFNGILEKAESIGGVEGIILEGSKGRVNISYMNDLYLVTVTSKKADMNYVNTVTRVLIPTILRLLEKIHPAPLKSKTPPFEVKTEIPVTEEPEEQVETPFEENLTEERRENLENETLLPEPPVNQLIIEDLGGLLVPSDTVRIDSETLSQWEEFSDGTKIEEVEVETFDGKTTRCKVKPIKDSKYKGKGIVRMPEKIQLDLEIKKGELVRVKPVVD
jgi:predicted regulator of Ras-like GTPase activity (Roadblock/LC7/MglB family)